LRRIPIIGTILNMPVIGSVSVYNMRLSEFSFVTL